VHQLEIKVLSKNYNFVIIIVVGN